MPLSAQMMYLNKNAIPWNSKAKHLGNFINNTNDECDDLALKRNDFIARSNSVLVNYRSAPRKARVAVFISKCCSLYGSQTWRLSSRSVEDLHKQWRKIARRILNVPHNTRTALLPLLLSCKPFMSQMCERFLKFLKTIRVSNSAKMKWLVRNCSHKGTLNGNIKYIAAKWNLTIQEVVLGNVKIAPSVEESMLQTSSPQASPDKSGGFASYSPCLFGKGIVVHARQTYIQQTKTFTKTKLI